MSGAFEVTAGAFAVAGAADVLLRTGRELYNFLHNVADAPEELACLREAVRDTLLLYQTSKRCLDDLKDRTASKSSRDAVFSLDSANKALDRQIQGLTRLVDKFDKGGKTRKFDKAVKTWSRVKYVFSEAYVKKATDSLEKAKGLLASSLTVACRELSALGDASIETLVRQRFKAAGLHFDDLLQELHEKLDVQHQTLLSVHTESQQAITKKLDTTQQQILNARDGHDQSLEALQRTQLDMVSRQKTTTRIIHRTQKQTHTMLRTFNRADMRAANASNTMMNNLEKLSADVKQLLQLKNDSTQARKSGRDIFFLGERRDQIMAYLLPLKDNLDFAMRNLMSQHGEDVSTSDVEWLRSEFDHLIDSAAQEKAARYSTSTATPIDEWSYTEDTIVYLNKASRKRISRASPNSLESSEKFDHSRPDWLQERPKRFQRTWLIPTASGEMEISLPDHGKNAKAAHNLDEVALCCKLEQNCTRFVISARFLRDLIYASRPRICAQLNVFEELSYDGLNRYFDIMSTVTLAEFVAALQSREISPFHLNEIGWNVCLHAAAYFNRIDILNYLESQGVGQIAQNHDPSISIAYGVYSIMDDQALQCLLHRASDPSAFALQVALYLLMLHASRGDNHTIWSLVVACLRVLQREYFDKAENHRMLDCFPSQDMNRPCNSLPRLLLLLLNASESAPTNYIWVKREILIGAFLDNSCVKHYSYADSVDILSILIKRCDVNTRSWGGLTACMVARYRNRWDMWCGALQRNGRHIEEVLRVEKNEWLLDNDWRGVWIHRRYRLWETLPPNIMEVSGEQDSDESTGITSNSTLNAVIDSNGNLSPASSRC